MDRQDRIVGVLLGTAVGDAIGLPTEGLSRSRTARLLPAGPLRHRLLLGRGLTSDDTEHTCIVGQALLRSGGDPTRFGRALAWGLRLWLLGLPAGVGWATLRAIGKLWLGFPPERSGVFSAGNGPAMRAPVLGACAGHDLQRLRAWVRVSSRLTHSDPRAEEGALLVARAAALAAVTEPGGLSSEAVLAALRTEAISPAWAAALDLIEAHLLRQEQAEALADALGLRRGVTGFVLHTVPVALYCWLRHLGDLRAAVEAAVRLGGDSDSVGAIVGGLAGAGLGAGAVPAQWRTGLWEWPRSVRWMHQLAARLAQAFPATGVGPPVPALPLLWPALAVRNAFFFVVVVLHGLRRLLPPY